MFSPPQQKLPTHGIGNSVRSATAVSTLQRMAPSKFRETVRSLGATFDALPVVERQTNCDQSSPY